MLVAEENKIPSASEETLHSLKELQNTEEILEIECQISGSIVAEIIKKELQGIAKTYKMPGFREGHVPIGMVAKKEGQAITIRVIEREVEKAVQDIISSRQLSLASRPEVDVMAFDEKTHLTFKVKFELMPEIPALDLKSINLELVDIKVTSKDINKVYAEILSSRYKFEPLPKETAADLGNAVVIDFVGKIDGKSFPNNTGKKVKIILGLGHLLQELEHGLIGMRAHESKTIDVTLSAEDPQYGGLAGKLASFEVKMHEVQTATKFEEIDDDLAKTMGMDTVQQLQEYVQRQVEADLKNASKKRSRHMLLEAVLKQCQFKAPQSLLQGEFDHLWSYMQKNMQDGVSEEEQRTKCMVIAERRVILGIILSRYGKEHKIQVSDDEMKYATMIFGLNNNLMPKQVTSQDMASIHSSLTEKKIIDSMLQEVSTTTVEVTSDEFFEKYDIENPLD